MVHERPYANRGDASSSPRCRLCDEACRTRRSRAGAPGLNARPTFLDGRARARARFGTKTLRPARPRRSLKMSRHAKPAGRTLYAEGFHEPIARAEESACDVETARRRRALALDARGGRTREVSSLPCFRTTGSQGITAGHRSPVAKQRQSARSWRAVARRAMRSIPAWLRPFTRLSVCVAERVRRPDRACGGRGSSRGSIA